MKTLYVTILATLMAFSMPAFSEEDTDAEEENEARCQEWYGMSCGEYIRSRTVYGVRG